MKIIYVARDGMQFDNREQCQEYEELLSLIEKICKDRDMGERALYVIRETITWLKDNGFLKPTFTFVNEDGTFEIGLMQDQDTAFGY